MVVVMAAVVMVMTLFSQPDPSEATARGGKGMVDSSNSDQSDTNAVREMVDMLTSLPNLDGRIIQAIKSQADLIPEDLMSLTRSVLTNLGIEGRTEVKSCRKADSRVSQQRRSVPSFQILPNIQMR